MNFFFSFLIFTAPGDQPFFKADGRSDRVENWRIPKDTAVPLSPPTRNTQEAPAASGGGDSGREWPRRAGSTTQERPRSHKRRSKTGSTLFDHQHLAIILCCYFTDSLFFTANCLHFTFRKEQFFQARREVGQRRKMARSKRHSSPTRPSQRKHARNPCSQGKA